MYCEKCGSKLNENDKYCLNCEATKINNDCNNTLNINNIKIKKQSEIRLIISIIMGLITILFPLIFGWVLSLFVFSLPFIGLILSAIYRNKSKMKTLRRQAYGYPDDEYFFLKLFDMSRN